MLTEVTAANYFDRKHLMNYMCSFHTLEWKYFAAVKYRYAYILIILLDILLCGVPSSYSSH